MPLSFCRTLLSILFLSLFSTLALRAQAPETGQPKIQVTGTATLNLVPDELAMNITIRHDNANAKKAMEEYRASREGVLAALRAAKTGDTNITENGLSFSKRTERDYKSGRVSREYYAATTAIRVVLKDFASYPELVMELAAIPGVEIGSVRYRSSKETEIRQKGRIEAMEAAKKKAGEMAAVCGATLGRPLFIREETPSPFFNGATNAYVAQGAIANNAVMSELIVSDEAIVMRVSVYVEFALE